jgi:hypothetical protein
VGFEAGFFAGFFSYGIFLLINQQKSSPLSYLSLLKMLRYPILWALILTPLTGYIFYRFPLSGLLKTITPVVPWQEIPRFLFVWGMHSGLYLGAVMGLVQGSLSLKKYPRRH